VIADGARTPLRLYTLEPSHVLSVVNGYQTSAREAETLMRDRLGRLDLRTAPTG
jgi:hypothetical protein